MRTGFIGLGIMGSRMAGNLLKREVELSVNNRTKEKAKELVDSGAHWFEEAGELAHNSDIVFTMLSTPEAVNEVAFGDQGFVKQMQKNSLWADCSTVNPSFSKSMYLRCRDLNIRFMDAPVAGSLKPAENAELVFLVGGEQEDFNQISPLLEYMGKKSHHVGLHGMGAAAKMVVNSMLGQALIAFSEGITLGSKLGIDRDKLFDILIGGPLTAPFISLKKDNFIRNEYPAEFPLKWMHKDLYLASMSAYENNCALPSLNTGKELYGAAKANNMGELDMSAIYRFIMDKLND
ncbi:MAG: NAD(P)-dependent oxidoreductase [Bacteroidota bacterium]|nr:NAD(P)-dependent oxidoreductase [Bacteroidota bacterium]